jgi:hypothetical protein
MAISNIANINVGLPNESVGSDSLYTAFTKTRDNFTTLAACASPYNTFTGNGVSVNANSTTGVVAITNTGVTSIVAGTGVSISASNGAVTISSNGSGNGGSGTVTSVSLVSPNSTLNASGTIVSSGALSVDLNTIANVAGSYRSPNITVDAYGRVSSISNGNSGITSLSIIPGSGIAVTGSPATSTISNITVINTGVTRLNAGSGIAISGSNGNVTVGLSSIVGSVTSVGLTSSTLLVSGSPIVTSGVMSVNLPSNISLSGNITGGNLITSGLVTATGNITGGNLSGTLITGTLRTAAQPNVTSLGTLTSLSISGNAIVGNNLFVDGNLVYINVDTLQVKDPIINLGGGPNGALLTTNDGKDRGLLLNYYTTTPVSAFMGWDNGNAEFTLGSNVSVANEVITYNQLGNVRASTFIGSLLGNATTAGTITTNAQPNITSVGTLTILSVSGNANIGNIGTGGLITAEGTVRGGALSTGGSLGVTGNANIGGTLNVTGNTTFSGVGQQILGDFSNATLASRTVFQSKTTDTATDIPILPNGTAAGGSSLNTFNLSNIANSAYIVMGANSTVSKLYSATTGSATLLPLAFGMGASEVARFDTGQNFLVGRTTLSNNISNVKGISLVNDGRIITEQNYNTAGIPTAGLFTQNIFNSSGNVTNMVFYRNGTSVGTIVTTPSATAYNTSSDYRLKINPQPLTGSGTFIDTLQPKTWTWAINGESGIGFIAHEVAEVAPSTVFGEKDAVNEDGTPNYQAMEYGSAEFIAHIIAELQDLRRRFAQLETEVNNLKKP